MKNNSKYFILIFFAAISSNLITGQESNFASNISRYPSLDGKQLVIRYDLIFPDTSQMFDIALEIFYNDKMIQPQENTLTGSWGDKIKPGSEKIILWDFPDEFKGDISKVSVKVIATKSKDPLADFGFKTISSKAPFEVKFDNKSKNADYFSWKFDDIKSGNFNISTLENPVHKYKSGGTYNVELTAGSSLSKSIDTIMKAIVLGMGNEQEVQKHKKMKTIWLGSAVATAGIGGYCLIKSVGLYNDSKTTTTDDPEKLRKDSKTYGVIGTAVLVVSGVCITEVFIQSKKIKEAEQTMSMYFIPLDKGVAMGLAWNF
jgi:hypothetical protein